MSINQVLISGNLTRDAGLRQTQSGLSILGFTVAVNERRKNQQSGEWEDKPNYVDCKMFGSRAEKLQQYLTKGLKVAIAGRLSYSSWETNGQKHSKLEVLVDNIEFMTSRNKNAQPATQQPQAAAPVAPMADSDIPF